MYVVVYSSDYEINNADVTNSRRASIDAISAANSTFGRLVGELANTVLRTGATIAKSEFDKMPLKAVKMHQGRLLRIALGKCIYLIIRLVTY